MTRFTAFCIPTLAILISAGCASPPADDNIVAEALTEEGLEENRTVDSIRNYRIRGWRYVDRHHLILTTADRERYLLNFSTPCLGLDGALTIGFTSTSGGVTQFDDIVVEGPGDQLERCPIREMIHLHPVDE